MCNIFRSVSLQTVVTNKLKSTETECYYLKISANRVSEESKALAAQPGVKVQLKISLFKRNIKKKNQKTHGRYRYIDILIWKSIQGDY